MRNVIVYCTSHGTTEKAATKLADLLQGEVKLLNLKDYDAVLDLSEFDTVIIGASIHIGNIQRKMKQFMNENYNDLVKKRLGLFLCCMREGEIAEQQFEDAFPQELREISIDNALFGGEFLISKMNFFERLIVKKVSGTTEDTFSLNERRIEEFADAFNTMRIA
ncbi:flavodoxin domain-containing protein [Evansella sp. AB-P1]|uniref:flavodoxin domain-containing protein n=1 Tax=Evansella sp. AB-P1 TaxID=3037653 RepID=UPI00241E761F|nr:flavodoxin domain-containing protein [Evansella sp. AB-P1]MDG5790002.1 flavodoxin domain-containing protein [Evansella sp. AB-P1]